MQYSPLSKVLFLAPLIVLGAGICSAQTAAVAPPQESIYNNYLKNNQLEEAEQYLLTFQEASTGFSNEEKRKYYFQLGNLYARNGANAKALQFTLKALQLPNPVKAFGF